MPYNLDKRPSRPPHHRKPVPPRWLFPQASDAPHGDDLPSPIKPPEGHNGKRPPSPERDGGDELDDDGDDVQHDVDLPTLLGPGDDDELDDDGLPPFPWGDDGDDAPDDDNLLRSPGLDGDDEVLDDELVPDSPDTSDAKDAPDSEQAPGGAVRRPNSAHAAPAPDAAQRSRESARVADLEDLMARTKPRSPKVVLIPAWTRDAAPRVQDRIVLSQLSYWLQPKLCLKGASYPPRSTARTQKQIADATGLKYSQVTSGLRRLGNAGWIGWYTRKFIGQRTRVLWLTSQGLDLERAGSEHRPIAYRPAFAQYLRCHADGKPQVDPCIAGLFLSQVYFWISSVMRSTGTKIQSTSTNTLSQHYYITTLSDLADQVGISYPAARRSAAQLNVMGLIDKAVVKRRGGDVGMKFRMTPIAWELASWCCCSEIDTGDL